MSAQPRPRIAPEQYLGADRAAPFKSEYYDGYVYAISGGTFVHAQLGANVITELNRSVWNPAVVVEVLSESTERHDHGAKFACYRRVDSLQEYTLVSPIAPHVEVFRRQPDRKWQLSEYEDMDSIIHLDSLDSEIHLSAIYEKIALPPEEPPQLS